MRRTASFAVAVVVALALATPAGALPSVPPEQTWQLPLEDVREMLYDSAHQQLIVSGDASVITVDPTDGTVLGRINDLPKAQALVTTGDPNTVWVSYEGGFAQVELTSMTVTRTVNTPDGWCTADAVWALNHVWASGECSGDSLGSFVPEDAPPEFSVHHEPDSPTGTTPSLVAATDGSRLYISFDGSGGRYELDDDSLVLVAEPPPISGWRGSLQSWDDDGPAVLAAYGGDDWRLDPDSLEVESPAPVSHNVVPDPESDRLAYTSGADAYVVSGDGRPVLSVSLHQVPQIHDHAIAWLPEHALAVVADNNGHDAVLAVQPDAARTPTYLLAYQSGQDPTTAGEPITITGILDEDPDPSLPGLGEQTLSITRIVGGTGIDLGEVVTKANGKFTFVDKDPGQAPGTPPSYAVTYAGDADYQSSSAAVPVRMRAKPWDLNGDGYEDTVVAAPLKKVGKAKNAGMITVLLGGPTGLTTAGSSSWTQDSPGVPGKAEPGDQFGYATASADFNLDGYADVAVAANNEGLSAASCGSVTILRGSPDGLTGKGAKQLKPGASCKAGFFGEALAATDVNSESPQLQIGAPGMSKTFTYTPGHRLDTGVTEGINQVPGKQQEVSEGLGSALVAGDFNGDGTDELMIGAPGVDLMVGAKRVIDAGQVTVIPGSSTGLQPAKSRRVSKQTPGVSRNAHRGDFFGTALVAMHDRQSGRSTLVVDEYGRQALQVLPGGRGSDSRRISQETTGVPGSTQRRDLWGWFIRAVHSRGFDAPADLLVSAPGEGGHGALTIVPSTPSGLTGQGSKVWTQDTSGIPGAAHSGDLWGWLGSSH